MPVWMIELFGRQEINRAFWLISACSVPFWLLMLTMPHQKWVARICHPFFVPSLYGMLFVYMIYVLLDVTGVPTLRAWEARSVRQFIGHPLVFLVFWTQLTMAGLFIGMVIYQDARRRKWIAPVEIFLTWWLPPIGAAAYGLRLFWHDVIKVALAKTRGRKRKRLFPEKKRSSLPRRGGFS